MKCLMVCLLVTVPCEAKDRPAASPGTERFWQEEVAKSKRAGIVLVVRNERVRAAA